MRGFDPEFKDIVDYIIRITERIWEGKQVKLCHDYYSKDCPVYTLAGITIGAEEVTRNTHDTLTSFPDRTLAADAIIWNGNDKAGFHTSHRIWTEMTHLGDSDMGAATGKRAAFFVIAHCIVKDNRIIKEWLVRDNYMLAVQLGFDAEVLAKNKAKIPPQPLLTQWMSSEVTRLHSIIAQAQIIHTSNSEQLLPSLLHNIWNEQNTSYIKHYYDSTPEVISVAGRRFNTQQQVVQFYQDFFDTLSDIRFSCDYVCSNQEADYDEVAIRWTLTGTHTGDKLYGEPTGATVFVLGESHYQVQHGIIKKEWTIFDELAVLTQIYRARHTV